MKKNFRAFDGSKTYLFAILAVLVTQLVGSIIILCLGELGENASNLVNIVFSMFIQVALLTVYFYCTKGKKTSFGFQKTTVLSIVVGGLLGLCCIVFFISTAYAFDFFLKAVGYVFKSSSFEFSTPLIAVLSVICTVILAPLGEELIFRDALLSGLRKKMSVLPSILLCGAAFVLLHMNPEQTAYQFCIGCSAAAIAVATRSILPSIALHSMSNLTACLLELLPQFKMNFEQVLNNLCGTTWGNIVFYAVLPILGIGVIAAVCFGLSRLERAKNPNKYLPEPQIALFDEQSGKPLFTDDGRQRDETKQETLRSAYERNHGEESGAFGKKTFAILLIFGLSICSICYISAFFI